MYTTLSVAKEAGALMYYTGKPCPNGHLSPRYTSTSQCKQCNVEYARTRYVNKTGRKPTRWTTPTIIEKFRSIHGDRYDYSKVKYQAMKKKVCVICSEHGEFWVSPDNHVRGKKCAKCSQAEVTKSQTKDARQFKEEVRKVWGDVYDLSEIKYKSAKEPLRVRCKEHGIFTQSPEGLLSGKNGCSKCNHMKSTGEDALAGYLSTFTSVIRRDRTLIGPKELDIILPDHKIAVEYCGDYWHSSKSVKDEPYYKTKHVDKFLAAAEVGYRLITIYESEWLEHPATIKRLLRNAIGKSKGRVYARKCKLEKVTHQQATAFYNKYHPQGGGGHGENYALIYNDKIVACMRFSKGANDRGPYAKPIWTLTRYATRVMVPGGASRLLKAFIREQNPAKIKSFSDNRFFSGGMYKKLGFKLEAQLQPDYKVQSPKLGLLPKTAYQRRNLPARIKDHSKSIRFNPATDKRTEREITYLLGCGRLYDCGKRRWVWTNPQN